MELLKNYFKMWGKWGKCWRILGVSHLNKCLPVSRFGLAINPAILALHSDQLNLYKKLNDEKHRESRIQHYEKYRGLCKYPYFIMSLQYSTHLWKSCGEEITINIFYA